MAGKVRLLVVDRSQLLAWMVERFAPSEVLVSRASTFPEARKCLEEKPPDAAIFNLTPCHPDWRRLIDLCQGEERNIPFLCVAELDHYDYCSCRLPCRTEDVVSKAVSREEFKARIEALIAETKETDRQRFRRTRERWESTPDAVADTRNDKPARAHKPRVGGTG